MKTLIRTPSPSVATLRDSSPRMRALEHDEVAKALGGEPYVEKSLLNLDPVSLIAVRERLFQLLPTGSDRRNGEKLCDAMIPLGEKEREQLKELTAAFASQGIASTEEQVAAALLSISLQSAMVQLRQCQVSGV